MFRIIIRNLQVSGAMVACDTRNVEVPSSSLGCHYNLYYTFSARNESFWCQSLVNARPPSLAYLLFTSASALFDSRES